MPTKPRFADLNGIWTATYTYEGPEDVLAFVGHPMGGTHYVLRDGIVAGGARGGTVFHGEILDRAGDKLMFRIFSDGRYQDPDVKLFDPKAGLTNGVVEQHGELRLLMDGDTMLAEGQIVVAPLKINLVLRRVAALSH